MQNPTRTTLIRRGWPALMLLPALLTVWPVSAVADPVSGGRGTFSIGTSGPVPEGAHLTLTLDKPQYFLGENILIHVRLENDGDKPFQIRFGVDNDSSGFQVRAVGPDGRPVVQPARPIRLDVAVSDATLEPGRHADWSLPLVQYCRFDTPGRYTIDIHHDFGWAATPQRKYPAGKIALTLLMPTPAQARQVYQQMDAMPIYQQTDGPYADFSALRYPVYLPLLRARARATTPHTFETALQGIGSIPTPEATLTLMELVGDPDPTRAQEALLTLNERLPDPTLTGKLTHRSPFQDTTASTRLSLSQAAWRDRFAPPARAIARRLLASSDPRTTAAAAFVLECVGTSDDLPALTSALDTAIRQVPRVPVFEGFYPRSYGACSELERATRMRLQTGATVPASLETAAAQDEYLQALTAQPASRPADWPARCLSFLDGPLPYLRARTLETLATLAPLPLTLTDALRQRLPRLLLDRNEDIQVGACALAAQIKDPALLAPTLRALTEARDFPLPSEMTRVAIAQGGRWEALKFWADHLDDPARKMEALGFVPDILSPQSNSGSNSNYDAATGTALRADWDRFLIAHRSEIEAGKTYSLDSPEVQALFPPHIFVFGSGSF